MVQSPDWTAIVDQALAAVAGLSDREAASRLGISFATVNRFRAQRKAAESIGEPRGQVRVALLNVLQRGLRSTAYVPEADAIDLPDGAFLKPRAQAFYRERLGEYLTRGWPDAMVREAARSLISALDGGAAVRDGGAGRADELSEADQLLALTAGAGHVEKYIGARWRRST